MKNKEEGKQAMWETWFVMSCTLLIVLILTGTTENSKVLFPNWGIYFVICLVNLLFCLKIGTHKPKINIKKHG